LKKFTFGIKITFALSFVKDTHYGIYN